MSDKPPLPPLRRFNDKFVPLPPLTHVKGLTRVPTPNTDRSHIGELITDAGVFPAKSTGSSSVSPWTSGANRTTLAAYLLGESETKPVPRQVPRLKAYLTSIASPIAKRSLQDQQQEVEVDEDQTSAATVQNAIFKLQDTVRRVQLLAGNKSASDALEQSMLRMKENTAHSDDPSTMSKVELWRYRQAQLPAGTQTPTFDNEEQLRYVPNAYVDRRIYDIRLDPQQWFELKERVHAFKEEKRDQSLNRSNGEQSILQRNKLQAYRLTPLAKRQETNMRKEVYATRLEEAKIRRKEHEDAKLNPVTHSQRQEERHAKQALQWILLVMWGSRTGRLCDVIARRHKESFHAKKDRSIALIQRVVRERLLNNRHMSHVKAFIVRARVLRRLLTRVRVTVIRPRYVDIVRQFLQKVSFANRVFVAFRQFAVRVKNAQRLIRRWRKEKETVRELRLLQWNRCAERRWNDMTLMAAKGSSVERDIANRELEDLRSITEAHKLERLERYRRESKAQFDEAMSRYWQARKEVENAPNARVAAVLRQSLSRVPAIRILIPTEEVERLVRNSIREVRIQRQTNV